MRYTGDICGCSLDPGEGRTCEECQEAERIHRSIKRQAVNLRTYEGRITDDEYEYAV